MKQLLKDLLLHRPRFVERADQKNAVLDASDETTPNLTVIEEEAWIANMMLSNLDTLIEDVRELITEEEDD